MSKEKNSRRVAENEAQARSVMLKTSPQKLNLLAQMIRGKKVDKALTDLSFSKRRVALEVKKCLQSAIANAENNEKADIDLLVIKSIIVNQGMRLKRMKPRARGRADRIIKPTCHIEIILTDQEK